MLGFPIINFRVTNVDRIAELCFVSKLQSNTCGHVDIKGELNFKKALAFMASEYLKGVYPTLNTYKN